MNAREPFLRRCLSQVQPLLHDQCHFDSLSFYTLQYLFLLPHGAESNAFSLYVSMHVLSTQCANTACCFVGLFLLYVVDGLPEPIFASRGK